MNYIYVRGLGLFFYCGSCVVVWFVDYIVDYGDDCMKSVVLVGGIKVWVGVGGEYIDYVDGYDLIEWY